VDVPNHQKERFFIHKILSEAKTGENRRKQREKDRKQSGFGLLMTVWNWGWLGFLLEFQANSFLIQFKGRTVGFGKATVFLTLN